MNICAPTAGDVAAIGALGDEAELFPSDLAGEFLQDFLGSPESEDVWLVAKDGDDVVGLAYTVAEKLTVGTYNMLALGTARSLRGKGLGRALVSRTEQLLGERSARLLLVETSSQPSFEGTRRFYAKLGYREVARIPDFWNDGDDKVVCLKSLGRD